MPHVAKLTSAGGLPVAVAVAVAVALILVVALVFTNAVPRAMSFGACQAWAMAGTSKGSAEQVAETASFRGLRRLGGQPGGLQPRELRPGADSAHAWQANRVTRPKNVATSS